MAEHCHPKRVSTHGDHTSVAEDDLVSRLVIQKQLESLGYRPHLVGSGKEVLLALEDTNYDLIFMDCQMPEMDGFATARAIRSKGIQSKGREIPIIALTAYAVRGDQARCLEAGMDDYISKPAQIQELESLLKKWLKVYESQSRSHFSA